MTRVGKHPSAIDQACCSLQLVVLDDVEAGIDQLAAQQRQRRAPVEQEVVEGVGEDLGHPDQPGLDIVDEEEMDGAEQQAADADHQPDLGDLTHEVARRRPRREQAEQGRIDVEHQR